MSRIKTHVKIGEEVVVIAGNHKGQKGKVLSIDVNKNTVVVEGVRQITKAVRRSEQDPEGGLKKQDGPIHLSNVKKVG